MEAAGSTSSQPIVVSDGSSECSSADLEELSDGKINIKKDSTDDDDNQEEEDNQQPLVRCEIIRIHYDY